MKEFMDFVILFFAVGSFVLAILGVWCLVTEATGGKKPKKTEGEKLQDKRYNNLAKNKKHRFKKLLKLVKKAYTNGRDDFYLDSEYIHTRLYEDIIIWFSIEGIDICYDECYFRLIFNEKQIEMYRNEREKDEKGSY